MRTLVLGGARSGKSTHAEAIAAGFERVDYVATAPPRPGDEEWAERIALHQHRRPPHWRTLETGDVAGVLGRNEPAMVLVDCLALWLTRAMDECGIWSDEPGSREALQQRVDELVSAVETTRREVVLVSNEVGMSVVPEHWSGRFFRDQLGIVNMRVAAACERVQLCVAGIPMTVK